MKSNGKRGGGLRKSLLAGAATAMLALAPGAHAMDGPHGDDAVLPSQKVAIEGEYAPGTHGQRFDPIGVPETNGFASPKTNSQGNVVFRADYGNFQGAGIFGWERDDDMLIPIAVQGQHTEVGELPHDIDDYGVPSLNEQNQVAFNVHNLNEVVMLAPDTTPDGIHRDIHEAIFQWCPWDGLKVAVKEGDPAPGGGHFAEFFGVSENDEGDIAFIAGVEPSGEQGVFLKKAGKDEIRLIALDDQLCPSIPPPAITPTPNQDAFEINFGGPWLNNKDDVVFRTFCSGPAPAAPTTSAPAVTPDSVPHGVTPSVYIKSPGRPLRILFSVGDRFPGGGIIEDFDMGQRAINEEELVANLLVLFGPHDTVVVATKQLEPDHCDFDVCAQDGDRVIDGYFLTINGDATIAQDGMLVFPAFAGPPPFDLAPSLKPTHGPQLVNVSAILSCEDHQIGVVAFEGDKKPVDRVFRYGELNDSSNANCWATFVDETAFPTGVFLAPTPECQDSQDAKDP